MTPEEIAKTLKPRADAYERLLSAIETLKHSNSLTNAVINQVIN